MVLGSERPPRDGFRDSHQGYQVFTFVVVIKKIVLRPMMAAEWI